MEFVDGSTLGDIVATKENLDPEVAVGYILQAARGLAYAHQQGIVHRDIKPDNLMLNSHGLIKVADLGLVKVDGLAKHPSAASSPSPAEGGVIDGQPLVSTGNVTNGRTPWARRRTCRRNRPAMRPRSMARADIYSLGCTLYVLVTGRPPFEGKTAVEVITKHASQPIVPPEVIVKRVPKALSEIILKMVAKRPEDRYQTMPELIKRWRSSWGSSRRGRFSA